MRSKLPEKILTDELLTLCQKNNLSISYFEEVYYYDDPDDIYSIGWYKKIYASIDGFYEIIISEIEVNEKKKYKNDITNSLRINISLRGIQYIKDKQEQLINLASLFR
ncbi:MAG: hypothetical protein N2749_03320 [Clostridia bacterium]|nr:hypothetical protein [Clostridia bacterium]